MEDAAVLVAAPFFVTDTPPCPRNPAILYYSDPFKKPYPFDPAIIGGIDDVIDKKRACIEAIPSQFADKDSWQSRYLPGVPEDDEGRKNFIRDWLIGRDAEVANRYRELLVKRYGERRSREIQFAEAFELCQYGSQPAAEELTTLFPM